MDPTEAQYGVLKLQSPDNGGEYSTGQFSSLSFANPAYEPQATGPCYKVEDVVAPEAARTPGRWRGIKRGMRARWDVAKSIWPYMLTISFAYFVTLCLYPGIMSEIMSCHFDTWMPVVIMAIFNASDLIGKMLAAVSYDWTRSSMLVVAGCRVLLLPLLLLCAMPRGRAFISGEGYPMFFSMVLGLTNGLVGSIPMIQAPCKVAEEHRELAGNIMTLSYNVGLTAGSVAAYILDSMLGPPLEKACEGFLPLGPRTRPPVVILPTMTTTTLATTLAPVTNLTTELFTNVTHSLLKTTTATTPIPTAITHFFNATTTLGLV